jgi:hypothetical protein
MHFGTVTVYGCGPGGQALYFFNIKLQSPSPNLSANLSIADDLKNFAVKSNS